MSNETTKTPSTETPELLAALTVLRNGDFSVRLPENGATGADGAETARVFNELAEMLSVYMSEVRRVSHDMGTRGLFGAQAEVAGAQGEWQTTLAEFNGMGRNLTNRVRNFAQVTTAIATGDVTHKVTVGTSGEMDEWKQTVNLMVDQLNTFASELVRVSREVTEKGKVSRPMQVRGTSGVWQKQIESVNALAAKTETLTP